MSSLGELIGVGLLVFILAAPLLSLAMAATEGPLTSIGDSPLRATLFCGMLGLFWCRRFWRRYKARRLAHDLYYRHGIGRPPDTESQ